MWALPHTMVANAKNEHCRCDFVLAQDNNRLFHDSDSLRRLSSELKGARSYFHPNQPKKLRVTDITHLDDFLGSFISQVESFYVGASIPSLCPKPQAFCLIPRLTLHYCDLPPSPSACAPRHIKPSPKLSSDSLMQLSVSCHAVFPHHRGTLQADAPGARPLFPLHILQC